MRCSHRTDSGLPHFIEFGHGPGYNDARWNTPLKYHNGVKLDDDIIDVEVIECTSLKSNVTNVECDSPKEIPEKTCAKK